MGGNLQTDIRQPLNELIVPFYWRAHKLIVFITRSRLYDNWGEIAMNDTMTKNRDFNKHYVVYTFLNYISARVYFAFIHVLIAKIHD